MSVNFEAHDDRSQQHGLLYCPEKARALVMVTHGLQGHAANYKHVGEFVAQEGFASFLLDRRGSGESESPRGDAANGDQLAMDIVQGATVFRKKVAELCPQISNVAGLPLYVVANSFSARTVLAAMLKFPEEIQVPHIFLNAPVFFPRKEVNFDPRSKMELAAYRVKSLINDWMGRPLFNPGGKVYMESPLKSERLHSDPTIQSELMEDPRALREATRDFWWAAKELTDFVLQKFWKLRTRIYAVLGEEDQVVDVELSQNFLQNEASMGGPRVEYKILPRCKHLLDRGENGAVFFAELGAWLERISPPQRP